jgi:poly-gamma-glutamate synthase PgsB/CapB
MCLRRAPLRIAVTGTRGKSTIVRLIAAGLRGSGRRVVARTTGSRPAVILPDGSEREIARQGPPSLLEGKALLRLARKLGADTVVVELMSINPEYLAAEAGRLFKPALMAITNVRLDHMDIMGRTKEDIARCLSAAIPPRSTVFMPEGECQPVFENKAMNVRARLVKVRPFPDGRGSSRPRADRLSDFPENTALALAVTQACGARSTAARRAMAESRPDLGVVRAWKVKVGRTSRVWTCVSAFAANEPESTDAILAKLKKAGFMKVAPRLALLNLREDRPDRTRQWLAALGQDYFRDFEGVILSGATRALVRKLSKAGLRSGPWLSVIPDRGAEEVMDKLPGQEKRGGLLVGMGNFGGLGRSLVELWEQKGEARD